jgi:hypothetical protein
MNQRNECNSIDEHRGRHNKVDNKDKSYSSNSFDELGPDNLNARTCGRHLWVSEE